MTLFVLTLRQQYDVRRSLRCLAVELSKIPCRTLGPLTVGVVLGGHELLGLGPACNYETTISTDPTAAAP